MSELENLITELKTYYLNTANLKNKDFVCLISDGKEVTIKGNFSDAEAVNFIKALFKERPDIQEYFMEF